MAYTTLQLVQVAVGGSEALVQLSDQENTGAVNTAVVDQAIATADTVIDSYLSQRWAVPLSAPIPPEIQNLSTRWAARVLRSFDFKGQPITDDINAEKIDRDWLKDVRDGKIQLPGLDAIANKAPIVVDKATTRDSSLAISLAKMEGFI